MSESFTRPGYASVIIDGQFGSTGKGLIAGYLALRNRCDIATTNASANAGHTTIIGDRKFVTFHLPTFAVIQQDCFAYINAGAIVNPRMLREELDATGVNPRRVMIHPRAAVIRDEDIAAESDNGSAQTVLASTRKGVGTALANKILRRAKLAGETPELAEMVGVRSLNAALADGARVVVEVPQGFSLGINSGLAYPYCTSRDVTVTQGLSDACIHPRFLGEVMMSNRSYPIRVGNIVQDGKQIGFSGPCYSDQQEISFADIGQAEELTTVTKRVRRIFTWSNKQYLDATEVNRPTMCFLNFVNYMQSYEQFNRMWEWSAKVGYPFSHFGVGADCNDVFESRRVDLLLERMKTKWGL